MATDLDAIVHDLRESKPIPEGSSFTISFDVQDDAGAAIAGTSLDSCELTLYNDRDGEVINSREDLDILNANNGAVDGSGNGSWLGVAADSPIEQATLAEEDHTAQITWKWTPGSVQKTGRALVRLRVVNLEQVTS